jgi:hypothetical protein
MLRGIKDAGLGSVKCRRPRRATFRLKIYCEVVN